MVLVANNDAVIYTNASTDRSIQHPSGMSNWNAQLQSTLTSVIGEANYDRSFYLVQVVVEIGNAIVLAVYALTEARRCLYFSR
jgi:hypothetical protein